ncbi:MAG: trypsin-like peptidase domain-containing protein [Planctomycetes bacterium]|nr:trypsin-like peptidase domain-containing protein [Planctomycetota bacterium]
MRAPRERTRTALRRAGALAALAFALACRTEAPATRIAAGEAREDVLELPHAAEARYELDVPAGLARLELLLDSADADLDLSVAPPGDPDHEHVVTCEAGAARFALDRTSEPPLVPGLWSVRVAWPLRAAPRAARHELERLAYTLEARAHRPSEPRVMPPDELVEGFVDRASGGAAWFAIDVPPGASALRVDIVETTGDLDLALGRAPLAADDEEAAPALSQNVWGRESIVLAKDAEEHPLAPGRWYATVFDPHDADAPVPFRLRARFSAEPAPADLALPASLATSEDAALGFPLAAIVELETEEGGGSGTLLTEDGWILTNAHVVLLRGGGAAKQAVISVTLDPARPPRELYRARVEAVEEELDLALLRVTSGFLGQPLPPGAVFPHVELGAATPVHVGDPLRVVGFPDTGGLGSRVTISVTAGVVSGFDAVPEGRVLKTDAEITSGNSGGAALDAHGRLVGVPTSRVENGSGQLGYVHPVEWIPAEWRARMGLGPR